MVFFPISLLKCEDELYNVSQNIEEQIEISTFTHAYISIFIYVYMYIYILTSWRKGLAYEHVCVSYLI